MVRTLKIGLLILFFSGQSSAQIIPAHKRHSSSLYTSLISVWRMEESSGTRIDDFGANDLSDNNTVTSTAGKIGTAAVFTSANSEYLSIADNTAMSAGDIDFSFAGWVYLSTKSAQMFIFGKSGATANTLEYGFSYDVGTDFFTFSIRNTANTASTTTTASNFGSPSTGTWYFFVCYHDATANTIGISINNGTVNTASTTGGVRDSTNPFRFGAIATPAVYFDGRIDNVYFWKKVLSSSEVTGLYNGGSGKDYPF